MKKMTKKRLKELWQITSDCYEKAVQTCGYDRGDIIFLVNTESIVDRDADIMLEELDSVYRKSLCELESRHLDDIIRADMLGIQSRAKKTIESISIELLERHILDEKEKPS